MTRDPHLIRTYMTSFLTKTPRGVRLSALLALLAFGACESEATIPDEGQGLEAELIAPGPVRAAVIDVTGASSVEVLGGDVFLESGATSLRAIIVLFEPGDLEMTLWPDDSGTPPSVTLIDVADGDAQVPPTLEGYRVEVGS